MPECWDSYSEGWNACADDMDKRERGVKLCPRPINGADCNSAAWCVLSRNCGCDHGFKLMLRPVSDCAHCGGFGEVTGESPGVACPACEGTGKTPNKVLVDILRSVHGLVKTIVADDYEEGLEQKSILTSLELALNAYDHSRVTPNAELSGGPAARKP